MKYNVLKISFFVLLLILYGSFLVYKITLPSALDLPRQMQNGKDILEGNFDVITKNVYSFIEPDQPFANHHWLSGVFFYVLYLMVGWGGMVVFKVLILLATLGLLLWLVIKRHDFWLACVCAIPAIFILISRTSLRPEIFSYFLVVIFLILLMDLQDNPNHKRIFWLIPLQVIWVNLHLFFGAGILIVAGFLAERMILHYRRIKQDIVVRKLAIVLLCLIGAIFINPYGLQGAVYSFWVNSYKDFPIHSAEINTLANVLQFEPGFNNISAFLFNGIASMLGLSFVIAIIFRWRQKQFIFKDNFLFYLAGGIATGILGFFVIRGLPFFGLIFLPAATTNLNGPFSTLKEWIFNRSGEFKKYIAIISIIILGSIIGGCTIFGQTVLMASSDQGIGLTRYAEGSASFFKEHHLKGPIFNDTDIGSYLIGSLYPEEKVFVDNRFGDAYSASFFSEIYLPMMSDEKKWNEGLENYKFNTIFFYHYDGVVGARDFLYRRFYDKEWSLVYADLYAVIFVRNNPDNKDLISQFGITSQNIAEKLQFLLNSKNPQEKLAGADLLNLFGRFDISMPSYLKFVSQWPNWSKVWMVLGKTELTKSDQANSNPYLAAIFLERAIAEGWKTWESYSFLALAYYRTGQLDRARWAVEQELRIDPGNADGEQWLGILAEAELNYGK